MKASAREARWQEAYNLQKAAFERKKTRKENNLKEQLNQVDRKIRELEEQRHKLEDILRKTAQESFRDFETFSKAIVQQSANSHTSSDTESAQKS